MLVAKGMFLGLSSSLRWLSLEANGVAGAIISNRGRAVKYSYTLWVSNHKVYSLSVQLYPDVSICRFSGNIDAFVSFRGNIRILII